MKKGKTRGQREPGALAYLSSPVVAVLLLSLFAMAIYANSLGNGFVFDDPGIVVSNSHFRTPGQVLDLFRSGGWRTYRPVRTASVSYAHLTLPTILLV